MTDEAQGRLSLCADEPQCWVREVGVQRGGGFCCSSSSSSSLVTLSPSDRIPKARHCHWCSGSVLSACSLFILPRFCSPGCCGPGVLSYDEWLLHRYREKKGGPDGGFRWPADALALGVWVLGFWAAGFVGSLSL